MPAAVRVPSWAVWETAVFVLNALAFVLVGLQIRPILDRVGPAQRAHEITFALAVLVTVILARAAWVLLHSFALRLINRLFGRRGLLQVPPPRRAIIVAWCGMRGTES